MNELIATAIFVITLVLLFADKWHRVVVSALGAAAMVAAGRIFGFYAVDIAIDSVEFETLGLLLGTMIVIALLHKTGFFEFVAIQAAQRSGGSYTRLLLILGVTTTLLSMVLNNVTTIVLMAPMIMLIAELLGVSPVPLLISQVIFSNIGGMATLVGDPPNILIGVAAKFSFNDFLIHMGPPVLLVWIVTYVMMRYLFRKDLVVPSAEKQQALARLNASEALTDRASARRILAVLAGIIAFFFLESVLQVAPAFSAMTGAAIALAWNDQDVQEVLKGVEWDVLMFFIALFIMVGGLEHAGVLASAAELLASLQGLSPVLLGLIVLWAMVFLSAVIDNVPITIAAIPVVVALGARGVNVQPIWWAIALGAGLGGNATPIGSTANILVMSISERTDHPITSRRWLQDAVPTTIAGTIVASIFFVLFFNFLGG